MTDQDQTTPEGADDGADRPDWLLSQFSSPEEQAKSYAESRKEMDRLRSQLDDERSQFAAALERIESMSVQQPAPQADPGQNQLLSAYQQAMDSGDAAAMLSIQLALSQQATANVIEEKLSKLTPQIESGAQNDRDLAFRYAETRVGQKYGDQWEGIAPEVDQWMKEHPTFLPATNAPDAWEHAVAFAAESVMNAKAAEKLAEVERDRAAKMSAQTSTGGASGRFSTSSDEKKEAWDAVKGADVVTYGQVARG